MQRFRTRNWPFIKNISALPPFPRHIEKINENEPTNVCYRSKKSHSPNPPKNAFKCPPIVVSLSTAAARAAMAISFPFPPTTEFYRFPGKKHGDNITHIRESASGDRERRKGRENSVEKKTLLSLLAKLERERRFLLCRLCCHHWMRLQIESAAFSGGFFFGEKECHSMYFFLPKKAAAVA